MKPYTKEELARAKKADLIYLPDGLAERCANCKFITLSGFCFHHAVQLQIENPKQECCGFWDSLLADRSRVK